MTKESKSLKLACLTTMFAGLFAAAASLYLLVTGQGGSGAGLAGGLGLACVIAGAQCSRLANVPSNAANIRTLTLILSLFAAGVGAGGYLAGLLTIALACICAALACLAVADVFLAHRLVKALERV